MVLKIQICSLIVSFVYGILLYFLLEINSKFIYSSSLVVKIMSSFLFVLFCCLLYFVILMRINYGYIHFYFFLCIVLGYYVCKVVHKRVFKKK